MALIEGDGGCWRRGSGGPSFGCGISPADLRYLTQHRNEHLDERPTAASNLWPRHGEYIKKYHEKAVPCTI